jgi:hypothetical protein
MVIAFAFFIGKDATFYNIKSKDQICSFLDTKVKSQEEDPDKRWITTWNYYLVHLERFLDGCIIVTNLNVVAMNKAMTYQNHNG